MSTYREIIGKKIKKVSSDPSDGLDGQMWYNSTTGNLRGSAIIEAWVSTSHLGTGRYQSGSFGTQTAAVAFCGAYAPSQTQSLVEEYNGTGWSEETNFPAAGTAVAGAGTQTAGIACGGNTPSMTTNAFSYDGSSWTAANAMPYAANNMASCGLAKTSVIYAVGRDGSSGNSGTNKSLTFDGTNFSAGPTLNTTRMYNVTSGSGTGTAGLVFGGFIDPSPNAMTNTESYNGSSWSNEPALNVASSFCAGFGTQTNTVTQVNSPNYQGSEKFDGTSWTALPDIGVASPGGLYGASAGSTGDAGFIGGMSTTLNKTAEWNSSTTAYTAAAWSSGGNMNTPRYACFGTGSQTAALGASGYTGPPYTPTVNSEEYNGTSWTEGDNINTARYGAGGCGTQTAAVAVGGDARPPGSQYNSNAEEYDGSSWTNATAYPVVIQFTAGAGTQTTGVIFGGGVPGGPRTAQTTEYDGTNWTTASPQNLNTARSGLGSGGTQTAAIGFGGDTGPGASALTETYNGSTWTAGGAMNISGQRNICGGGPETGSTTDILAIGGPPAVTKANMVNTEAYDGTTWSTRPSLSTGRNALSGGGTSSTAIAFGGDSASPGPGYTNVTELYDGETTAVNIENFTTS